MGRTVYCRWCYERGHNKRTCPQYTESFKERAEQEVESNKKNDCHDTWRQEEYAKRIKADALLDGTPYDRKTQARSETQRRCSFCAKTDHNRRTCEEFKERKATFVERTKLYRELVAETLIKKGIGIGTLMANSMALEEGGEGYMYMVDRIDWDCITVQSGYRIASAISLKNVNGDDANYWNRTDRLPMPPPHKLLKKNVKVLADDPEDWSGFRRAEEYWSEEFNHHNNTTVVSPVDPRVVKQMIPEDWTDFDTINNSPVIKEFFKDSQSPNYYDNKWDS